MDWTANNDTHTKKSPRDETRNTAHGHVPTAHGRALAPGDLRLVTQLAHHSPFSVQTQNARRRHVHFSSVFFHCGVKPKCLALSAAHGARRAACGTAPPSGTATSERGYQGARARRATGSRGTVILVWGDDRCSCSRERGELERSGATEDRAATTPVADCVGGTTAPPARCFSRHARALFRPPRNSLETERLGEAQQEP